jgi:hypothetical protein
LSLEKPEESGLLFEEPEVEKVPKMELLDRVAVSVNIPRQSRGL